MKGAVFSIKDHLEQIQQQMTQLSTLTAEHNGILEQTRFTHPTGDIVEECNFLIEKAESEISIYSDRFQDCNIELIDFMEMYDKTPSSTTISRESSPAKFVCKDGPLNAGQT